jgi:GTP-binding protein YchF
MEVGIVGLQGSGKSTLFQALTEGATGTTRSGAAGGIAPNIAIARVPDPRLNLIAQFVKTKAIVPATIRLVDIPGFPTGADSRSFAKQVLAHIREVEALCHVVKCFEEGTGETPMPMSPTQDIEAMELEMIFADLAVAEPALDKATRGAKGVAADRDAKARVSALEKAIPILNEGRPIRSILSSLTPEEQAAMRGYGMISAKPVLYVANVSERDVLGESPSAQSVRRYAESIGGETAGVCARLEAELVELDPADRQEMLASLGLSEPALAVVARGLYRLLGLTSFYTAGDKEVRAWPIPHGATAPQAAGAIHSDIQRGFIRAECYHVDDLVTYKSEKAVKEAGRLRSEGKGYLMQDGDVVHFLFNV